jgi:hypothetical protein
MGWGWSGFKESFVTDDAVMHRGEVQDLPRAGCRLEHAEQGIGAVEVNDAHRGDVVAQRLLLLGGGDVAARRIEREHRRLFQDVAWR